MKKVLFITLAIVSIALKSYSQPTDTTGKEEYNRIFTKVEEPPKFPGGEAALHVYIKRNLSDSITNQIKTKQTAIIQFITDKEGNVSNVKSVSKKGVSEKFAEAAILIVKNGPRWVPAYQNGRRVTFLNTLKISYPFSNE